MQSDSPRRSRSAGGVGQAQRRRDQREGDQGEGERERRKLGSSSSSPRRPHASAVPRRLPLAPGAVAMAAVAVLRNDSLQAFLQVSTRGGGRGGSRRVPRVRPTLRGAADVCHLPPRASCRGWPGRVRQRPPRRVKRLRGPATSLSRRQPRGNQKQRPGSGRLEGEARGLGCRSGRFLGAPA